MLVKDLAKTVIIIHLFYSLNLQNWPQAERKDNRCFFPVDVKIFSVLPASTIVRVWNNDLQTWQKIKATLGYFCYNKA